jgi:ADP-ribosylglycohydrolase/O-acetyl-ADP-ribose deacetylase (regulator of RNase III)
MLELDVVSLLFAVSAGYLGWRLLSLCARVSRARRAYPRELPDLAREVDEERDRARATLLGSAVGDALGLPFENLPRQLSRRRFGDGLRFHRGVVRFMRRPGDVSDDTQLTIAVARSIDPRGEYLPGRFSDELAQWWSYRVAAGRTTTRAARRLLDGRHETASFSHGNGAAVRVAPLALAHRPDLDEQELLEDVALNTAVTHQGHAAESAARLVALLVWRAVREPAGAVADPAVVARWIEALAHRSGFPLDRYRAAQKLDASLEEQLVQCGTSGHALVSTSAVLVALAGCRGDFARAMSAVLRAGGDTDSIAAMLGAILGASLGTRAIPRDLAERVQHRATLIHLADRLAERRPERPAHVSGRVIEIDDDISQRHVDAIVNAWNQNFIPAWLLLPRGVSRAIRLAGGRRALGEVSRRGPLPLGAAVETTAGELRARWVLHAAGLDLSWRASPDSVRAATRSALALARWLGARSVALPLIGAGTGGLRPALVRRIMLEELELGRDHFDRLELVCPLNPAPERIAREIRISRAVTREPVLPPPYPPAAAERPSHAPTRSPARASLW